MSKQHRDPAAAATGGRPPFVPVPVRPRHDGWTPGRQVAFINALAATANVDEACRTAGMSQQSAYRLRSRADAVSFRQAWAIAIDHGVGRLADKAMARAMDGVVVPIFYRGEQVGEKRVFNERLTTFLLRAHDPIRYGAWRDRVPGYEQPADAPARLFGEAVRRVAQDALAEEAGTPLPVREPLLQMRFALEGEEGDARSASYDEMCARFARMFEEQERELARLRAIPTPGDDDRAADGD